MKSRDPLEEKGGRIPPDPPPRTSSLIDWTVRLISDCFPLTWYTNLYLTFLVHHDGVIESDKEN